MFLSIFNLTTYYLLIVFIQTIISDPICIYDVEDGLKLDIRTLGFTNGKVPKYDQISNINPTKKTLSWNGCFSYSKVDNGNCTNAAACYTDSISNMSIIIAKQDSVQFKYNYGSSILSYQYSNIHLTVFLICRVDGGDTSFGYQVDTSTYTIYIQSRCCCPGMCSYSTHSISPVVILIIIIIIFLFGYIIGSIIFLRYDRNLTNSNGLSCLNLQSYRRNRTFDYQNL
ncbi:unnamed protein product [Rotaria sp. Silwood2]|nr:unnamed protein product [Rotaria sp. Silwood2]CAF3092559.1 unnamed protein product [Rotaria sp. Silwood2]CAF4051050.1 unnamed protein product [Rotaria sp. Silwood2]CAF4340702.1 unnamed protein product [Rotaria sp. Silwood2]